MGFWSWFFLLLIFVPLLVIYVMAVYDIFTRPGLSGGMRALWLVVVFVFPFVGTVVYLLVHGRQPSEASALGRRADSQGPRMPT